MKRVKKDLQIAYNKRHVLLLQSLAQQLLDETAHNCGATLAEGLRPPASLEEVGKLNAYNLAASLVQGLRLPASFDDLVKLNAKDKPKKSKRVRKDSYKSPKDKT